MADPASGRTNGLSSTQPARLCPPKTSGLRKLSALVPTDASRGKKRVRSVDELTQQLRDYKLEHSVLPKVPFSARPKAGQPEDPEPAAERHSRSTSVDWEGFRVAFGHPKAFAGNTSLQTWTHGGVETWCQSHTNSVVILVIVAVT